jgi:hypothetical protein
MVDLHAFVELARADAQEGHAVAVRRVHVGLDFEYEAAEFVFFGRNGALYGFARSGRWRIFGEGIEQFQNAELLIAEPKKTGVSLPAR